jgi:hypothetical protein
LFVISIVIHDQLNLKQIQSPMRSPATAAPNTPNKLLSRLMIGNLQEFTSIQLVDLFVAKAREFEQEMENDSSLHQLDHLQAQLNIIKDEIFKRSNN